MFRPVTELDKALAWAEWFCVVSAENSPSIPTDPTPGIGAISSSWWSKPGWPTAFWARPGICSTTSRYWQKRDSELKSLAVGAPQDPRK
jgi:hypothetical protein